MVDGVVTNGTIRARDNAFPTPSATVFIDGDDAGGDAARPQDVLVTGQVVSAGQGGRLPQEVGRRVQQLWEAGSLMCVPVRVSD